MEEQSVERTFRNGEIKVKFEKAGLEHPADGDLLVLGVTVSIAIGKNAHIKREYQFGERLNFIGKNLTPLWGHDGTDFRFRTKKFYGESYNDALVKAEDYIRNELEVLNNMLKVREDTLKNA